MANDFDSMNVTSLDVVADVKLTQAKLIVSGTGYPRPIVINFDERRTFEASGRLLAACDQINRGQFVAVIRQLCEKVLGIGAVAAVAAAPAASAPEIAATLPSTAVEGEPSSGSDLAWLIDHAVSFQEQCRKRGLSDAVIASLVHVSMGENVLMALAEGAISRSMPSGTSAIGASPPWHIQIGQDPVVVDVDADKGCVLMQFGELPTPGDRFRMSLVEAHLLGSAFQAASSFAQRARLASAAADAK